MGPGLENRRIFLPRFAANVDHGLDSCENRGRGMRVGVCRGGSAGFPQNKSRLPCTSEWIGYKSERGRNGFVDDVASIKGERSGTRLIMDACWLVRPVGCAD